MNFRLLVPLYFLVWTWIGVRHGLDTGRGREWAGVSPVEIRNFACRKEVEIQSINTAGEAACLT